MDIQINKVYVPYMYVWNLSAPGSSALGVAGNPSNPSIVTFSNYDFQHMRTMYYATNNMALVNVLSSRPSGPLTHVPNVYINNALPDYALITDIAGSGSLPYFIQDGGYRWSKGTTITMRAQDISGQGSGNYNNIQIVYSGYQIFDKSPFEMFIAKPYRMRIPNQQLSTGMITLNANQSFNALLTADTDMEIRKITVKSTGLFTVTINYGFPLSSGPIYSSCLAGENFNGTIPFVLSAPFYIGQSSQIKVTVADMSGSANNIFVTLHGSRLLL